MRRSDWLKIWEALRELGAEVPDFEDMDPEARRQAAAVRAAHHHHRRHPAGAGPQARRAVRARQPDLSESWFSKIPQDIAEATFGHEHFIRASDTTGAPLPEDDLFAGLRP